MNGDGYDYYTKEKLIYDKNNSNDPNYPNVDHKISIKYGFDNGYSIEELSDINNLCITSKKNNSKKSYKQIDENFVF